MIYKFCAQCGRRMSRKDSHSDLQWRQKRTCGDNCRQKLSQRRGKRGVPYNEWVPNEQELAEIERAKAEIQAGWYAGLVYAGED